LCEIITDKVNAELPSTEAGILAEIYVGEGVTVKVGEAICALRVATAESASVSVAANSVGSTAAGVGGAPVATAVTVTPSGKSPVRNAADKQRFSPAVRQLVEQHQVNVGELHGSGLGGRITRRDVLEYVELRAVRAKGETVTVVQQSPKGPLRSSGLHLLDEPAQTSFDLEGIADEDRGEYIIDVTPVRSTIATRMRQSVSEIPHAWTMIEVDVTNLVMLRQQRKDEFKQTEGFNLTYLPFVIKAVVNAIKDYPVMNSVWAVDKIIIKRDINISLAVGTENAVWVPVIRNAGKKSVLAIAREVNELGQKARNGTLKLDDMQGGTFTINNTGAFGSMLSQPIINFPQAANLTFESIIKRPVVIQDMIAVRSMANICLSLDHRILDGVVCGRFLQRVREHIENYSLTSNLHEV
jgi:2-oxoisovalerate dehydrogenase E2 component (dihydrolipoyl transacylase)